MKEKGTGKRARRRHRKFGAPIGTHLKLEKIKPVFLDLPILGAELKVLVTGQSNYMVLNEHILPTYKNKREAQSAKDRSQKRKG